MELPINTIVILVMLLVLVIVVLILVSRGASNFTDIGEDKMDASECEILCWECCRGMDKSCDDVPPLNTCGCLSTGDGC